MYRYSTADEFVLVMLDIINNKATGFYSLITSDAILTFNRRQIILILQSIVSHRVHELYPVIIDLIPKLDDGQLGLIMGAIIEHAITQLYPVITSDLIAKLEGEDLGFFMSTIIIHKVVHFYPYINAVSMKKLNVADEDRGGELLSVQPDGTTNILRVNMF